MKPCSCWTPKNKPPISEGLYRVFRAEIGDIFISFISTKSPPLWHILCMNTRGVTQKMSNFVSNILTLKNPNNCNRGSDTCVSVPCVSRWKKTEKNVVSAWLIFSTWFGPVQPRSVRSVPDSLLSQVRIDFVMLENSDLYSMSYNIPSSIQ